ncbi:hypothetical protein AB0E01_22925 [Nocardia vinacea]|uniref:hypothetical protein n=1 Tax=Nocardia vinacea TaxID=96468 RepID=UPI0033D477C2
MVRRLTLEGVLEIPEEKVSVTTDYWLVSDSQGREIGTTLALTAGTAVQQVTNESQENRSKAMFGGGAFARRLTDREVRARGLEVEKVEEQTEKQRIIELANQRGWTTTADYTYWNGAIVDLYERGDVTVTVEYYDGAHVDRTERQVRGQLRESPNGLAYRAVIDWLSAEESSTPEAAELRASGYVMPENRK